jgi:hypothetical protein
MSENLTLLERYLAGGDPIPPVLRRWLADGIRRYRHGCPLESALGLSAANRRTERDRLLRIAADTFPGSPWKKAEALAGEISKLHQGRRCNALVAEASRHGKLPKTVHGLYLLLK